MEQNQNLATRPATSAADADSLYRESFVRFRQLFQRAEGDVAKIFLPSYIPAAMDEVPIGPVATGAIVAMLDHGHHTGGGESTIAEVCALVENLLPAPALHRLDDIILEQTERMGVLLLQSPLAIQRVRAWERSDYHKYKRWLAALDRAARVGQRATRASIQGRFSIRPNWRGFAGRSSIRAGWHGLRESEWRFRHDAVRKRERREYKRGLDCKMSEVAAPVKIKIRAVLLPSLRQMHRVASSREVLSFAAFLGEIIESAVADFRRARLPDQSQLEAPRPGRRAP